MATWALSLLNHTEIAEKLRNVSFIRGAAPRWLFLGKVRNPQNLIANTSVSILVVNSSQELGVGLGRDFPQRILTKNVSLHCDIRNSKR